MDNHAEPPISEWIHAAKHGDDVAIQALWERYYERLVHLADNVLAASPGRIADGEDVALSALASFYKAAQQGRFPDVVDRDSLWRLLVSLTARKAVDQARYDLRIKRGGGQVRGESAFLLPNDELGGMEQVPGSVPRPDFAAMMAERIGELLSPLDEHLRRIALAKLDGFSNTEIASQLDCSVSTVERGLRLIRKIWQHEIVSNS